MAKSEAKNFLDERTLWRLTLTLKKQGSPDSKAVARVRFIEAQGYEPPQGRLFVEDDYNGFIRTDDNGFSGIWTLSEDKNDRKDGLWVWGLFEEPKYPYLYFYLGIIRIITFIRTLQSFLSKMIDVYNSTVTPSGEEIPVFNGEGIPNGRLDIRFNHIRDKEKGAMLSNGYMTFKLTEFVKADPFGIGGRVDVGDVIDAGTIDIGPVFLPDS